MRHTASVQFANTGSLHPLNLVQLLAPYLFKTRVVGQNTHELGLYVGAVPVVLCAWLLLHRKDWGPHRNLVRGAIVFCLLALLLAAGEYGGLYRLQSLVPLANRFRFPCRAIVLVQLSVAVATAVAAALLLARSDRRSSDTGTKPTRELMLLVLLSGVLAMVGPLVWPQYVAAWPLVLAGPLLIAAAVGLVTLVERRARGAAVALVLFTAADLGCYGLSYSIYHRTADLHEFAARSIRPPDDTAGRVAAPQGSSGLRVGDRMLLAGVSRVDGYAGLEPAKRLDYNDPLAWQKAGVAWVLEPAVERSDQGHQWTRVWPTAPRARLVTRTLQPGPLRTDHTVDWNTATSEPPLALPRSNPGTAQVVADAPGRITVKVDCPARQLLVTTESYDSLWSVTVDGQPETIVRVDGDFLGCVVAAGQHRVQFEFRPAGSLTGGLTSICGLGLLVVVACFPLFRTSSKAI